MPRQLVSTMCIILIAFTGLSCGGYSKWQYNVERHGASFEKIRFSTSGTIIASLRSDSVILGWPCRKGWVHFNSDWTLQNCTLSRPFPHNGFLLPAGTWIELDRAGELRMCAFPDNIDIQGYTCIGTGGVNGYHVTFYPGGRLKYFYPEDDIVVGDIPVKGGLFSMVGLHENGSLMEGTLSEDAVVNGKPVGKGHRIHLTDSGAFENKD